jgi:hypothetical protein
MENYQMGKFTGYWGVGHIIAIIAGSMVLLLESINLYYY